MKKVPTKSNSIKQKPSLTQKVLPISPVLNANSQFLLLTNISYLLLLPMNYLSLYHALNAHSLIKLLSLVRLIKVLKIVCHL